MHSGLRAAQHAYAQRWLRRDGHTYRPDHAAGRDPVTGTWPCATCGRFAGSFLHTTTKEDR